MRRSSIAIAIVSLVAATAICGCGASVGHGKAEIWVTRDRGASVLEQGTAPAGLTALQGLDRVTSVKTDGGFVNEIAGLERSSIPQRDWFFFINGYESDRGADAYRLHAGDIEWWDYRAWSGDARQPVVVGAFPEPFLHGFTGKRRPAAVRYQPGFGSEARALARVIHAYSIAPAGTPVARGANLLVLVNGKSGLEAGMRLNASVNAGDPVQFVVSGKSFARRLARDPAIVRFRFEGAPR